MHTLCIWIQLAYHCLPPFGSKEVQVLSRTQFPISPDWVKYLVRTILFLSSDTLVWAGFRFQVPRAHHEIWGVGVAVWLGYGNRGQPSNPMTARCCRPHSPAACCRGTGRQTRWPAEQQRGGVRLVVVTGTGGPSAPPVEPIRWGRRHRGLADTAPGRVPQADRRCRGPGGRCGSRAPRS